MAMPRNRSIFPLGSLLRVLFLSTFITISFQVQAVVDSDGDGLVDVHTLAQLNAIRYQLDGAGLKLTEEGEVDSTGCPMVDVEGGLSPRCHGYELMQDLDFDTNANGVVDAGDSYWNVNEQGVGEGWLPLGDGNNSFTGDFNGNGFEIKNLYINRGNKNYIGFFGNTDGALIEKLVITSSSITGSYYVAVLAGRVINTQMKQIYVVSNITGRSYAAGLTGYMAGESQAENCVATGLVTERYEGHGDYIAGLVGAVFTRGQHPSENHTAIANSYSSTLLQVLPSITNGGLVGYVGSRYSKIINSYWANELAGSRSSQASIADNYVGLSLEALRCPVAANSNAISGCVSEDGAAEDLPATVVLYNEWDPSIWDFGTGMNANQLLPGLILNGQVVRDNDGDGVMDGDDAWPLNRAVAIDSDMDGHPDSWTIICDDDCILTSGMSLDKFPSLAGAWQDDDLDGLIDQPNNSCASNCEVPPDMMDNYPGDLDNDGTLDITDTDDNDDGIRDADSDSDGLIDIDSLEELDAMRYQSDGAGQRFNNDGSMDSSGCPVKIFEGVYQRRCHGYELTQNLDFDTNGNDVFDAGDSFWNVNEQGVGEGWEPVGITYGRFTSVFNGNGFAIRNLYINRPSQHRVGLFSRTSGASIDNLALVNASVTGSEKVGGLVGLAEDTQIKQVFVMVNIKGGSKLGGLAGVLSGISQVESVAVTGSVFGGGSKGGLVGRLGHNSSDVEYNAVVNSYSVAKMPSYSRALIGEIALANSKVFNSYWSTDLSGSEDSSRASEADGYVGLSSDVLRCPVSPDSGVSSGCVSSDGAAEGLSEPIVLYQNWDSDIWDFGSGERANEQLPGLIMNGRVIRDNDGDGVIDEDDAWPDNRAAAVDNDKDGYPDHWTLLCDDSCAKNSGLLLDSFPTLAGAWFDADLDGLVDEVNAACAVECEIPSSLMDDYPSDYDNDGIADINDPDVNGDGFIDADSDSDGLIDIANLEELNAMRYQLAGAGLKFEVDGNLDTSGCPVVIFEGIYQRRCHGYELTQDLDFDSNNDGVINDEDSYWNADTQGVGRGWLAVAPHYRGFTGEFNGNGYAIRNLFINRPTEDNVGLFGSSDGALIKNLVIVNAQVTGLEYVSALVGMARRTRIKQVYIAANIKGEKWVAGLAAKMYRSEVENSAITGVVNGDNYVAGLVGEVLTGTGATVNHYKAVSNSYSTAKVIAAFDMYQGGLVGSIESEISEVVNSYWAVDLSGQRTSSDVSESDSYVGLSSDILKCPTVANSGASSGCVSADGVAEGLSAPVIVYQNWDSAIWEFASEQQLPALKFNGRVFRDSDNDGVTDEDDVWPTISAAAIDNDNDGYPDRWAVDCDSHCIANSGLILDSFPTLAGAWLDADLDGLVDELNSGCTVNCYVPSALLDALPGDFDNDGILDLNDTNNYGIPFADRDSNGLIEIDNLAELNAMRYQLDGAGQRLSAEDGLNVGGCPVVIFEEVEQRRCRGYELTQDLNFDTNGNGIADAEDSYWNANSSGIGEGWEPIAIDERNEVFTGELNGNGFTIHNLYINRPSRRDTGLFDNTKGALIENLAITSSAIMAGDRTAVLVGKATYTQIKRVFIAANVEGDSLVAGLVAYLGEGSYIENSAVTGSVVGNNYVGGLVGLVDSDSTSEFKAVKDSYSTAQVKTKYNRDTTGGLVYLLSDSIIQSSYWSVDLSGQQESSQASEEHSYIGLILQILKCPTTASSDASNGCVSVDGIAEGLSAPAIVYRDWDSSVWDFGTDQQLPGLKFNGQVIRDSDSDGLLDSVDGYPLVAIGDYTDTDNDGRPNSCDESCIDLGMTADLDDDNDGLLDEVDPFSEVYFSLAEDIDSDGYPNDCNQACIDLGMVADTDDDGDGVPDDQDIYPLDFDNDGVDDLNDYYPQIALGNLLDTDGDGRPDNCNQACLNLGMSADLDNDNDGVEDTIDAFELIYAASVDADGDGLPDFWNDGCDSSCQLDSELSLDRYSNDTDNDGVTNELDPELSQDNGHPVLLAVAPNVHILVNSIDGSSFKASKVEVDQMFAAANGEDAVDSLAELTFKAYLNGDELVRDSDGGITLASGLQVIKWIAVDRAGNESYPLEQKVFIYPQVRFNQADTLTGEATDVDLIVELSGESPVYPVNVIVKVDIDSQLTSIDQTDLGASFDIVAAHQVVIGVGGDDNSLNTQGQIVIPVLADNESENDELLMLKLIDVDYGSSIVDLFQIDGDRDTHELTVTERNLAPFVELLIEQGGVAVEVISQDGGEVTITAQVSDLNGSDTHTLLWDLDSLGLNAPLGNQLSFSPNNLTEGDYVISIEVIDSGANPEAVKVEVKLPVTVPATPSSASSGGGSFISNIWWVFALFILIAFQRKRLSIK